jgi:hypothetical protein
MDRETGNIRHTKVNRSTERLIGQLNGLSVTVAFSSMLNFLLACVFLLCVFTFVSSQFS